MHRSIDRIRIAAIAVAMLAALLAQGQRPIFDGDARTAEKAVAVAYLFPEQVTVAANKPSTIALHFRVAQGLHINSHAPKDEYLIPTTFSLPVDSGVRLEAANYPTGNEFVLPLEPQTKLSVYAGEFVIQARIVASTGNHLVEGKLRYQACDNSTCMPPKTIPVVIDVVGK